MLKLKNMLMFFPTGGGLKSIILLFLLLKCSFYAMASPWVEVNKIESFGVNNKNIKFSYSWPFEDDNTEVSICKSGCVISPFFEGAKIYTLDTSNPLVIQSGDNCYTMKCIWNKWNERYGTGVLVSTWQTTQSGVDTGCWAFLAFPYTSGNNVSGAGVRLPGTRCTFPPPESVYCSLSDLADFDHGTLSSERIDGASVSQQSTLNCNAASKVNIYMAYGDSIELGDKDSGLYSKIYIEGNIVTSTSPVQIDAPSGGKGITIESRLNAPNSVKGGEYSGSGVLILDVN